MKAFRSSPFLPVAEVLQDFMTFCCELAANVGLANAVAMAARIRNLRMEISRLGPKLGAPVYRRNSRFPSVAWNGVRSFHTPFALFAHLLIALGLLVSTPAFAEVYRCGNKYQSFACSDGQVVDVRSPVSTAPTTPTASADTSVVFLCKRYSGRRFWASRPCDQYERSMLERQVRVPAGLKWKEKLAYATRERHKADALQTPPGLVKR